MPRLLLADDSVTIQRVIELTFAEEGIEVVSVSEGRDAIERLATEPFDIVLADVGMPGHDGFAIAEYVSSRPDLSGMPVVLLTGAFAPVDEARVAASGAAGLLVKPFEPQMVIAKVRELLSGAAAPRTPVAAPPPPPPAAPPSAGADDYFDRLDRAFAGLSTSLEPREAARAAAVLAGSAAEGAAGPPAESGQPETTAARGLADTFQTLLAVEQGELPPSALAPPLRPGDEAIVDRVARRVVEQLSDRAIRELAADIVSETAERLVREEIERIKAGQ